jgi:hypothetical protein
MYIHPATYEGKIIEELINEHGANEAYARELVAKFRTFIIQCEKEEFEADYVARRIFRSRFSNYSPSNQ